MDFQKAFKFPLDDPDAVKKVLIGGVLSIIPVVNFISFGYAVETLKNTVDSKEGLPNWDFLGRKFVKGITTFVIYLIYMLIPALVMVIFGIPSAIAMTNEHDPIMTIGLIGFIFSVLLSVLLAIVIGFIIPMAIVNYVANDEFSAAFRFSEIIGKIKDNISDYIVMYLLIIILSAALGFVAIIPILGIILIVFIDFYLSLVFAYILGNIYLKK